MQSGNGQANSGQLQEQPPKLVLTANDDEKLVRYLELLIKIDKRMKKGQGNEQAAKPKVG